MARPTTKQKKVLIVEDDAVIQGIVANKLASNDFEVKTAMDGMTGLALAKQEKPNVIILDIMMPLMDGHEFLRLLRSDADQTISHIPVLILSNLWDKEHILKAQQYGITDYLIKAYFTPDEILKKIQLILGLIS